MSNRIMSVRLIGVRTRYLGQIELLDILLQIVISYKYLAVHWSSK